MAFAIQDDPVPPPKPPSNPPALTVSLSASPTTVVVGHSTTLHAVPNGGTPPFVYSFSFDCSPNNGAELVVNNADPPTIKTFCCSKVGTYIGRVRVDDSSGQHAEKSVEVESQTPNTLMPMPDINDETNEGQIGDTVVVLHRYVLKRGNTQVGPCLKACAWEKDWTVGLTVPEPDDWEVKGCECQTDSAFCFLAPYVYDKKIYIIPATFQGIPWNDVPDGTVLDEFFHRVKVDVPNCDGSFSEVKSPKMLMQLIKVSDTKVRFNLVNN